MSTPSPKLRKRAVSRNVLLVRDLGDTDLTTIAVKLPAAALKAFRAYGGGEPIMYPVGQCMGYGFMMSPEPPPMPSRRLFPMPPSISPADILDWRVVGPVKPSP